MAVTIEFVLLPVSLGAMKNKRSKITTPCWRWGADVAFISEAEKTVKAKSVHLSRGEAQDLVLPAE